MPHKVAPPCGYIRDVCYNDYVPAVKRARAGKKSNAPPAAAPAADRSSSAARAGTAAAGDPSFAKLVLAFLLS